MSQTNAAIGTGIKQDYITSEELFNSIKEDFKGFDNNNLFDEGMFYRHVVYVLGVLGAEWYEEIEDIVEVKNFRVALPTNFQLFDQLYRCHAEHDVDIPNGPQGIVLTQRNFNHYPTLNCNDEPCGPNNTETGCVFNEYEQILVQRAGFVNRYSRPTLLRIGNKRTKSYCKSQCRNLFATSADEITVNNGYVYTNFKEGNIYWIYRAIPIDEETSLPLIPHNQKIMKCIEDYIKWKLIENAWVNTDADVANKVPYFERLYKGSLNDAITETKTPEFARMVNNVRRVKTRLDVYQMQIGPNNSLYRYPYNITPLNSSTTFVR